MAKVHLPLCRGPGARKTATSRRSSNRSTVRPARRARQCHAGRGGRPRRCSSWLWLERLVQDARYALRSMAHDKAFTLLVVSSLALGIGANTAIYSFMDCYPASAAARRDPHRSSS